MKIFISFGIVADCEKLTCVSLVFANPNNDWQKRQFFYYAIPIDLVFTTI